MGLSENLDRNPVGGRATEAEMLNEYGTYSNKFCSPIPLYSFLDFLWYRNMCSISFGTQNMQTSTQPR